MSSTAKKKPASRPEIKMTRAAQLRQKPLQQTKKIKLKEDLPSEQGVLHRADSSRSSLAPPSTPLKKKTQSSSTLPSSSMKSLNTLHSKSRETLHSSSSSLGPFSAGSDEKKRPKTPVDPKSITARLYRPPAPNPELQGKYLRKTNRDLPDFERRTRKKDTEPAKTVVTNLATVEMEPVSSTQKVYDWLHRKARSTENLHDEKAFPGPKCLQFRRRSSNPRLEFDSELESGILSQGRNFLQKYFQQSLVWLTPKVDAFLTARNLGPKLPSTTNEERYVVENPVSFVRLRYEKKIVPIRDEVDSFVDMIDMPSGQVSMEEFSGYVVEKCPSPVPFQIVASIGIQTDCTKRDAGTNTRRPLMVTKQTGTESRPDASTSTQDLHQYAPRPVHRVEQIHIYRTLKTSQGTQVPVPKQTTGTSTDDLKLFILSQKPLSRLTVERHEVPIIRVEDQEVLSDSSTTPRASPVSVLESSSAYGSLSSNSLRRNLVDMVNNIQHEGSNRIRERTVSKSIMTDEETSEIHSELNRLALERIEIIELLALNILNLPSSLTVELLEAKLNQSIGQTDQLLALLKESWELETNVGSLHERKHMVNITQEIIKQSRTELEESKKAINMCLEEVKNIKAGGRSRKRFLSKEVMKMKRRAEIESFKLERMWEQLYHERRKTQELLLRSSYSALGRTSRGPYESSPSVDALEKHVHYLTDLQRRSQMSPSEEELANLNWNNLRLQTSFDRSEYHPDNWDTCSINSTSSRSSFASPGLYKDNLVELRRHIVEDSKYRYPTSPRYSSTYYSSTYSAPSSSRDTGLGASTSSWSSSSSSRFSMPKYSSSSSTSASTSARRSSLYKSSYIPSSSGTAHSNLLSPMRASYRSAGRYSVR